MHIADVFVRGERLRAKIIFNSQTINDLLLNASWKMVDLLVPIVSFLFINSSII